MYDYSLFSTSQISFSYNVALTLYFSLHVPPILKMLRNSQQLQVTHVQKKLVVRPVLTVHVNIPVCYLT